MKLLTFGIAIVCVNGFTRIHLPEYRVKKFAGNSDIINIAPVEIVGDEGMIVMEIPDNSCVLRPFFISLENFSRVVSFIERNPGGAVEFLMFVGPVKSGKSSMLHRALPFLIEKYSPDTGFRPFIVRFSFFLNQRPDRAALTLVQDVVAQALSELGIVIENVPTDSTLALVRLPSIMGLIARRVKAEGATMWLLIDELQGPILSSPTVADADEFTGILKAAICAVTPFGRVAMTGSGMVVVLNAIRSAPVNGFDLMSAGRYIQLGLTPSNSAALSMSRRIMSSYGATDAWPPQFLDSSVSDNLVMKLENTDGLLSSRPAVVAEIATYIRIYSDELVDMNEAISMAIGGLCNKVGTESQYDYVKAIGQLRGEKGALSALYELACGRSDQMTLLVLSPKMIKFIELLCQRDSSGLQLLPPYKKITLESLNGFGEVLIDIGDSGLELSACIQKQLKFYSDGSVNRFDEEIKPAISKTILQSLFENKIGVLDSTTGTLRRIEYVEDVLDVPELRALLTSKWNHVALQKHVTKVQDKNKRYATTIGLSILSWVRNIVAHEIDAVSLLAHSGFSAALLDQVTRQATQAVLAQPRGTRGYYSKRKGVEFGPPEFNENIRTPQ